MVLVNRNVAPSFNTIIEILQNDQRKIKLIRKYENTRKKIINNECAILFNKTCVYIYIYIYIFFYFAVEVGDESGTSLSAAAGTFIPHAPVVGKNKVTGTVQKNAFENSRVDFGTHEQYEQCYER